MDLCRFILLGLLSPWAAQARHQPVVYEISTRPWLYALAQSGISAKCGSKSQYVCLRDVPESEWQAIAKDSVDMVWLMGMWQLGDYGLAQAKSAVMMEDYRKVLPDVQVDDVIGSPYSVQSYTVNSDIGTSEDLAAVRSTLHKLGIQLMLDFVPNHAAVDSVLPAGIFLKKPQGSFPDDWWGQHNGSTYAYGRGPYDGPWTDTLQINYWQPETVSVMTNILKTVASQADAIRCDMGMLILNDVIQRAWGPVMAASGLSRPSSEFWQVAISAVRKEHPGTVFMAEAYNYYISNPPEKQLLQQLGFDFVYDKTVLDILNSNNLDSLKGYIGSQSQDFFEHTSHFVENHDEPRAAALLHGQQQAYAGSIIAATIPGLRLFYFGQLDGLTARLAVQLRRASPEAPNKALHAQYTKFLSVLKDDVFHEGTWVSIPLSKEGSGWRLVAWRWSSSDGTKKRLVVVNFSDAEGWADIVVPDAQGDHGGDSLTITELLSGAQFARSAAAMRTQGLSCGVDAWSAQIFSYESSSQAVLLV